MFKLIKKLFHRSPEAPTATAGPRVRAASSAPAAAAMRQPEAAPGVEVASLSLRAILDRLPADLKAAVNQMPEGDVKVILPVNAIMKQLPSGSVKMSLGSLYRQAPNGTFRKTNLEDKRMIEVPLAEVFKNINPARLHRRNDQRQYEVPDDVQGLFGSGATRDVSPPKAAPAVRELAPPEPARSLRMPSLPAVPESGVKKTNGNGNGHAATPAGGSPSSAKRPEANGSLNLTGELSLLLMEIATGWPEGVRNELSVLTGDTKVVLPVAEVSAGLQRGKVAFTWEQIRGWLMPQPTCTFNLPEETVLLLPLKIVAPAFVAATGAKKRQTTHTVNQALPDFFGPTAGRTPVAAPEEAPPAAEIEAPAELEAPEVRVQPLAPDVTEVDEAPQVEEAEIEPVAPETRIEPPVLRFTAAPAAPAEPVAPIAPVAEEAGTGFAPGALAELFQQPGKTDWAPNELVKYTCELPGVLGAVVALEEGLVVAQKLPEGLSADTFAAFMPQIFNRLDKYTGEMQLGDTAEVTVDTAGGPCRFFRRGKMYFATLGRSGESLPAGLHLVAAELANQNS